MKGKVKALLHAANAICSTMELDKILHCLIKEVNTVVEQTDVMFIFLYDSSKNLLLPYSSYGIDECSFYKMAIVPGESIAGQVFQRRNSMLCRSKESSMLAMRSMAPDNLSNYQASVPDGRYPESAICAPILYRDECLGVMTIDRFIQGRPYTEGDRELLESIANMAAVAIANARLYGQAKQNLKKMHELNRIITSKSEQLEHALEINKGLAMVSLTGQGINRMCETLSQTLSSPVVILNEFGEPITSFAVTDIIPIECLKQLHTMVLNGVQDINVLRKTIGNDRNYLAPVSDGSSYIGFILILNAIQNQALLNQVCEIASLLLAIEFLRVEREKQFKEDSITNSFKDLLGGNTDESILENLQKINPQISHGKYVVSMVQATMLTEEDQLRRIRLVRYAIIKLLKSANPKCVYMMQGDCIVVLYTFSSNTEEGDIYRYIEHLHDSVNSQCLKKDIRIKIGTGHVVDHLNLLPRTFADAKMALYYINSSEIESFHQFYHELGMRKLFIKNSTNELYQYYIDTLGAVKNYDDTQGTDLLRTIRVYINTNYSLKNCAKKLKIHTNTVSFRIHKVKELLNQSEEDINWHEINIAFEILDYLKELKYGQVR